MPGFGRFETVEELASSGPFSVFAARSPGEEGPPKFVIKTFHTVDEFGDPEIIEARAKAFLDSAKTQQELAKAAPECWAPVYDFGRTPTHAYFVTDLYELTAHKLIDSRRDMTPAEIVRLVLGMARALDSIRKTRNGRGHGDLKPTNVLISAPDNDLTQANVFLIDPEPDARLVNQGNADDQRALADMLHQLVVFRPGPKGGAVQGGPEWSAFGKPGEVLRSGCEWLLNPQAGAIASYDDIVARLAPATEVKSGGSKKGLLIAGVAGVVLIGGAVGAWLVLGGGPPKVVNNGGDRPIGTTTPDDAPVVVVKEGENPTPALNTMRDGLAERVGKKIDETQAAIKNDEVGQAKIEEIRSKFAGFNARIGSLIDQAAKAWAAPATPADPAAQAAQVAEQKTIAADLKAINEEIRVAALGKQLDGLKADSFLRLNTFMKERLAAAAGDEISQPALRDGLKVCLQSIVNDLGASDPSRGGYWEKYQPKALAFEEYFKKLDTGVPLVVPLTATPGSDVDVEVLNKLLVEDRKARVDGLVKAVVDTTTVKETSEAAAEIAAAGSDNSALRLKMQAIIDEATAVEQLLALGYGLTEAADGGKTLATMRDGLAAKPEALRASVSKVIDRVGDLEKVTKLTSIPDLMKVITGSPPGDVAKLLAAWSRLPGAGFPESVEDLAKGAGIYKSNVMPGIQGISQPARQQALLSRTRQPLSQMWIGFAKKDGVADPKTLTALFGAMDACDIKPETLGAAVGPFMAFNYSRWKVLPEKIEGIRTTLAADPKKQSEAIKTALEEFWARPETKDFKDKAGLAPLRKTLQPFEDGKGFVDFAQVGPGTAGWAVVNAPDDASRVTYGKGGRNVTFVRVTPEDAASAAYLATTEVPVGLFAQLLPTEESGKLLKAQDLSAAPADNRKGPRTWEWENGGLVPANVPPDPRPNKLGDWKLTWGNGWFAARDKGMIEQGISQYPQGVDPAPPSADTPMNYLGPAPALLAARKAGCRLPTPQEWQLATKLGNTQDVNLRGPEWVDEHAYVSASIPKLLPGRAVIDVGWPNEQIYQIPGQPPTPKGLDNQPAATATDSWLWFRPVKDGPEFSDLVGNVAEFVVDDGGASATAGASDTGVEDYLKANKAKIFVIGGSALSPPAITPAVPQKVARFPDTFGYSDVGFRLAFSTDAGGGSGKPADRLLALLSQAPFLTEKAAK
ncbi:MAG: hypothetical protein WC718_11390 [Phycisphaerales bacterium]|jgi:hypothetical protein